MGRSDRPALGIGNGHQRHLVKMLVERQLIRAADGPVQGIEQGDR